LLPCITFFFLRDWDLFVGRVASLVPRDQSEHRVAAWRCESSDVLGAFLRGQLLVMLVLGVLYGLGLSRWARPRHPDRHRRRLSDVRAVPRPATVIMLGVLPRWCSTATGSTCVGVLAVFGVGQVIESYWLTPKLVGDRIGLHPVAVIFAVLAGGQLFGFLGMLLALPVAAIANVPAALRA
jgi:predicted PurR-regulated permease PerM